MVQLVNGYACHNSADAALARRGIDPAAAKRPAAAPTAPGAPAASVANAPSRAVAASQSPELRSSDTSSPPQPGTGPRRGQILDLIA